MTYQNAFKAGVCCIAAAGLFGSSLSNSAKEQEPLRLAPSSKWNLHAADDSCRLLRSFGEGKDKVAFFLERFEPGHSFSMLVAGRPFRSISSRDYANVRFGDAQQPVEVKFMPGSLTDYDPALIFRSTWFGAQQVEDGENEADDDGMPDSAMIKRFQPEEEAAIEYISVNRAGMKEVVLETGSMGAPMAAMRLCTDNLLKTWGIDIDKHRSLASEPKPLSPPQSWLKSSDYPSGLLRKGVQGIVNFRLSVDPTGTPTACHIQQSTRPVEFDKTVCDLLMRRARFEPAVTKNGEAIASYWRNTVVFTVG